MKPIKRIRSAAGVQMVIAQNTTTMEFYVFTKEEYSLGAGYRYPEYEGIGNLSEAEELSLNYGTN